MESHLVAAGFGRFSHATYFLEKVAHSRPDSFFLVLVSTGGAMAYLDDWYSTLAKNLKAGSTKRFFWKGYEGAPGEMEKATSLFKDVSVSYTHLTLPTKRIV